MSTVKANAILDASGGNTTTINGVTPTAYNTMGRNRIINGDMRIDQRGLGTQTVNASGLYTVDRWQANQTAAGKFSVGSSTTAPAGFTNSYLATSLSAYSVSSSDIFFFQQNIEGYNIADFAWGTASAKTITISFWVRSSLTGTFGGCLANSAHNRSYPFSYSISAADTWEQKSITVVGDTSGTWLTTNGLGLQVIFGLGGGSTRSGTAGSWQASTLYTATGATSLVGTSGATFYITGVQLEVGSVASEFERRPYGTELALCQRYYWNSQPYTNVDSLGWAIGTSSSTYGRLQVPLPTTMRAKPTISYDANVYIYSPSGPNDAITSITANYSSTTMLSVDGGTSATLTTGAFYLVYAHNSTGRVIASAEL